MPHRRVTFPGKSLDALSDAENKVNTLETLDNLPEEIL
jgi:hypothetical protein